MKNNINSNNMSLLQSACLLMLSALVFTIGLDNALAKKSRKDICSANYPRPACYEWEDEAKLASEESVHVKASHIQSLRQRLDERRSNCGFTNKIWWSDGDVTLPMKNKKNQIVRREIRGLHINELRDQVRQFVVDVKNLDPNIVPQASTYEIPKFDVVRKDGKTPLKNSDIIELRNVVDEVFCKSPCDGKWSACSNGTQTFTFRDSTGKSLCPSTVTSRKCGCREAAVSWTPSAFGAGSGVSNTPTCNAIIAAGASGITKVATDEFGKYKGTAKFQCQSSGKREGEWVLQSGPVCADTTVLNPISGTPISNPTSGYPQEYTQ